MVKSKTVKYLGIATVNVLIFFLLVLIIEFTLFRLFLSPPNDKPHLLQAARDYYRLYDADILQYNTDCSQFDEKTAYRYRPGTHSFSNREFDTTIQVNSLGVRDDEESLIKPEIIVMGDSYSCGWGVEQEESFPQILEKKTGCKVLNLGISSYGTAREAIFLERVDLSGCKCIIVQYCNNDVIENRKFILGGAKINTMNRENYELLVAMNKHNQEPYFLGKYIRDFLPVLWGSKDKYENGLQAEAEEGYYRQARKRNKIELGYFTQCLEKGPVDLNGLPIIVFELSPHNMNDSIFIDLFNEHLSLPEDYARRTKLLFYPLDVKDQLTDEDYFVLDNHINKTGHIKTADMLYDKIMGEGFLNTEQSLL